MAGKMKRKIKNRFMPPFPKSFGRFSRCLVHPKCNAAASFFRTMFTGLGRGHGSGGKRRAGIAPPAAFTEPPERKDVDPKRRETSPGNGTIRTLGAETFVTIVPPAVQRRFAAVLFPCTIAPTSPPFSGHY